MADGRFKLRGICSLSTVGHFLYVDFYYSRFKMCFYYFFFSTGYSISLHFRCPMSPFFLLPPLHPSLQLDSIVTNRSISGSCQSFDYRFFIFEFFGMIQSTGWCHVWHYLHNLHCPGLIRFETTRKSSQWRRSTARVTWPGRLVEDVVHRSIFGASWTRCRLPTVNLISKLWCFVGPFVALRRFLFICFFLFHSLDAHRIDAESLINRFVSTFQLILSAFSRRRLVPSVRFTLLIDIQVLIIDP